MRLCQYCNVVMIGGTIALKFYGGNYYSLYIIIIILLLLYNIICKLYVT